jgi:hypothetical protein
MGLLRHSVAGWLLLAVGAFSGFGQQSPSQRSQSMYSPEGAARVVQMTGQVSVLRDSTPWALQVGSIVQVKQIIVTGDDGFALLEVSDGSTFEVYPNSKVTFRNNPSNWKDLLDLWLGRVKVHIQKIGGQPNNNRIKTPTAVISVRGTVFDVVVEDEASTLVAVEEGQVTVTHAIFPTEKLVSEGESLRVYKDQPLARRSSPVRDLAVKQGLQAAAEALYRIVLRSPTPSAGGGVPSPTPGGGAPIPGDTETAPPPPPPPPPAAANEN